MLERGKVEERLGIVLVGFFFCNTSGLSKSLFLLEGRPPNLPFSIAFLMIFRAFSTDFSALF